MRVCAISFKECWQQDGRWYSYGGFPAQMAAIGSLFDEMTLLITEGPPRAGAIALPADARVIALRAPQGTDSRRKLDVMLHLPYYLREIAKTARTADVVHVPLPDDIPLLGMLVSLVMRKPLLARYCSSWPHTEQESAINRLTKYLMRRFAGGRNIMLATGLGKQPPGPGMNWIFASAIDQDEIDSVRPNLNRLPDQRLSFVYLGRLSPEKGVRYLIEAWGILREMLDSMEQMPYLTLIGDGPQRSELMALSEQSGCQDYIRFAGQLNRPELMARLLQTDVCVLPSLTESFGKARLEALLCGTPVITTDVGFGREIIGQDGERGWIVPTADSHTLARTIKSVLVETIDWPALRGRCRTFAEQFTIQRWADEIGRLCAVQWHWLFVEGKLLYGNKL